MAKPLAQFQRAQIVKAPEIKEAKNNDSFISFVVKEDDHLWKILCFDDERVKNPFKKMKAAIEHGSISKNTYVTLNCEICRYETTALSDDYWARVGKGKNPTKVYIDTFKLIDWDYLLPKEVHDSFKLMNEQITPITPEQMGGSIL